MAYFETKNPNLGKILKGLAIEDVGIFYSHFTTIGIFVVVLYILWLFGIFFPVLVCCTKKNLATLITYAE
jgi:hypothetical protein